MCKLDLIKESVRLQGNLNEMLEATDPDEIERHFSWLMWRACRIRDYRKLQVSTLPANGATNE